MLRLIAAAVVFLHAFLALSAGGAAPALAEDTVFRCGADTVAVGDSRYTVQKVCGKPTRSESVAKGGKDKKQRQPKGTTSGSTSGKLQKWTYDRGYGDYVYVLTFANDKLSKIEKSGRGR